MDTPPRFTELLDWVEGRLAPRRADEIAVLVASGDQDLRDRVDWIRAFLDGARALPLATPPPELSERLRAAFTGLQAPTGGDTWTDAALLHDTRAAGAGAGRRSVADGISLSFDSPIGRFVVEVSAAVPGEVDLSGLVLAPEDGPGVDVSLLEAGELRRAVHVDRDGRFEIAGVPVSVDEMWLRSGEIRVRVALDLAAR